eukprot:m.122047 g.122047  ORF g.122047 m.122047 type:complete len:330 (+) comp16215_c1_seq2:339-1328(+)
MAPSLPRALRPYLWVALIFVAVVGLRWYWALLRHHGSFSLPAVLLFTEPGPLTIMHIPPPADWMPTSRLVVSLTTTPSAVEHLRDVLGSLGKQTLQPDAIYVNLPLRNARTQEPYVVPSWLETFLPNIRVLRPQVDVGPLCKLLPALVAEDAHDTIVITVDDDKIYPPEVLRHLAWYAEMDPTLAVGMCGYSFMSMPKPEEVVGVNVPWMFRGEHGRTVEVLQGVCGVAYRRGFFPDLEKLSKPAKECFTTDDLWISGYLATVSKVPRVLIPGKWHSRLTLESYSTEWLKAKQGRVNRLSDSNKKAGTDIACVRGVERELGPWWPSSQR